ncbi:MAG: bifunctional phosphoribosylaminoimidazolecarboxamide formyltransferase/IMP cyclohydrolase [Acidobacteriota bacterium]|nr:bifunctional phosphoribosylaminoimidazolecarboxamide formyltransferase/IMP cyclohydrolase [Blastocatellia bacterium]MDW8411940.1 bifunctional phosphoribosylaminoimidazolecarboxamide formyltransferase/IMP cyclohydrolase [Acidobacteriota bacterium]
MHIKTALISVSDKTGLVELAKFLAAHHVKMLSTGGTASVLREAGIATVEVSQLTGFAEILGGRVKTLHPRIYAGLLAERDKPEHQQMMQQLGLDYIDLLVVNLYPFKQALSGPLEVAIENIDIGGAAMIRAAAKNYRFVTVVVDPADYNLIVRAIEGDELSEALRLRLATKAFSHTAKYDLTVAAYFAGLSKCLPEELGTVEDEEQILFLKRKTKLRYGENPHQFAALYVDAFRPCSGITEAVQLQGKELSYNNYLDMDAAVGLVDELDEVACVIVKHTNPCGVGLGRSALEAFLEARAVDQVSAFGGIVAFNAPVDAVTAEEIAKTFFEVIVTPGFSKEALERLSQRKNLRLVVRASSGERGQEVRSVEGGGLLVQTSDDRTFERAGCQVKTKRQPTELEWQDMKLAWTICKHAKSNAIVYVRNSKLLGIGAGQTSRIDAARFGAQKVESGLSAAVMASDAFFPFRDSVDEAARQGVTAIIQPGGSIRDQEVIDAADEHNLAMVFTGIRHLRH